MRNAFADEIEQLAAEDPRIVLLSGDIGNRLFDKFKARFPDRFYNCGVAEANMITMAAGLAMTGLRPVVYTIASFLVYRPYEQIRIDIGYHNLPVTLVGVGGGLSYASNGVTHHATEDIAVMRAIPTFSIFNAGDAMEVRAGLRSALASDSPFYLRIGKKREPVVHEEIPDCSLNLSTLLQKGNDCTVLASGTLLPRVKEAVERLAKDGVRSNLYSMPFVRPLDEKLLKHLCESNQKTFIVEEHNLNGGIGTAIIDWATERGLNTTQLTRIAIPNRFISRTTTLEDARATSSLSAGDIAKSIAKKLTAQ